jgi:hypothetical protein
LIDHAKRREISNLLKLELDKASEVQFFANAQLHHVSSEIPSNIPHPDGMLRIQQAGRVARDSLANYLRALKRYTGFIVSGIVPDDFIPPHEAKSTPECYRIILPTLALFSGPEDQSNRAELIPADTVVTVDAESRDGGPMVNVTWEDKRAAMFAQDLLHRAKPEPITKR